MDDLISRQAAIDKLNEFDWQELYLPIHFKQFVLDELPAAQPEQRTGHWFDVGSLSCRCSECGGKSNRESRYCPNCGAWM